MKYLLDTPLAKVRGIGPKWLQALQAAQVETVGDLLVNVPNRYQDRSAQMDLASVAKVADGAEVTVLARVDRVGGERWGRRTRQQAVLSDGSDKLTARWFNSPFVLKSLRQRQQYYFSGKYSRRFRSLTQPVFEPVRETQLHTLRLVPEYGSGLELSSGQRRRVLHQIFTNLEDEKTPLDLLLKKQTDDVVPQLAEALKQIHFPDEDEKVVAARRRLALEELLSLIRFAKTQKKSWQSGRRAAQLPPFDLQQYATPFQLTPDQKSALTEIATDLTQNVPMNRLLMGDVGAGKTVVAGLAGWHCINNQQNVALVAPTKILAEQHTQTLTQYWPKLPVKLLTSRSKPKIEPNQPHFWVGTHALINQFSIIQPSLVIYDEQHRFGVSHRSQLIQNQLAAHVLTMTATPIPRSLMLTIFAHLSLSQIRTLPPGRIPTKSLLLTEKQRAQAFLRIEKYLEDHPKGLAVVVCPFIQPSKLPQLSNIKDATSTAALLAKQHPKLRLGLLHGKLPAAKQSEIIKQAAAGEIDILVTTTVVEVGLDLPNADILVIEAAERFGLASLHQLRGRVGRRGQQGFCLLFQSSGAAASSRLEKFCQISDGEKLAELDLNNRGAGDLFGIRQHGFDSIRFFGWQDLDLIAQAQKIDKQLPASWQTSIPSLLPNQQLVGRVAAN